MKETTENIRKVCNESELSSFLEHLLNTEVIIQTEKFQQDYFFSFDWPSMVAFLNCGRAGTRFEEEAVCPFCGADKQLLRHQWYEQPFKWYSTICHIGDFFEAANDTINLDKFRYCWMHGVANLLSNCLNRLYEVLPIHTGPTGTRGKFKQILNHVCPGWDNTTYLRPVEMKEFFHKELHKELADLYPSIQYHTIPWEGNVSKVDKTFQEIAILLLDSVRVYYKFAYSAWPSDEDFLSLLIARRGVLAVHAAFKWDLKPTVHYMTNHAIIWAQQDKTAYHTLQEGVEHKHQVDAKDSQTTYKATSSQTTKRAWEQILEKQELRRVLTECGYMPPQYQPLAAKAFQPLKVSGCNISPPKEAPQ